MEFNTYDDGTYYFLYVTEEVRIETNGIDGLQLETCDSRVCVLQRNLHESECGRVNWSGENASPLAK